VVALLLLERGRFFVAGLIFSACLLKWSLFLPLPIFLFSLGSRRLLCGFGLGTILMTALSFIIAGPRWLAEYVQLLRDPAITRHVQQMPNLTGLLASFLPRSFLVPVIVSAAVCMLALVWLIVSATTNLWYAVTATCLAGILIPPHSYLYDCGLLVPFLAALACLTTHASVRYLAIALLTPAFGLVLVSPGLHVVAQLSLVALLFAMAIEVQCGQPREASVCVS
jgi:hypothetical protein